MDAIPSREELLDLANRPIGGSGFEADLNGHIRHPDAVAAARRAQNVWLPCGKKSPLSKEAREAERIAKSANYDLEEAVVASGGRRGSLA